MNACPACHGKLTTVDYDALTVYRCETCGGYLAAEDELRELAGSRQTTGELPDEAEDVPGRDSPEFLDCPQCGREMVKKVIHGPEVFTVDACKECHLMWFDPGELPGLRRAYEQGLEDGETAPTGPDLIDVLLGDRPFQEW